VVLPETLGKVDESAISRRQGEPATGAVAIDDRRQVFAVRECPELQGLQLAHQGRHLDRPGRVQLIPTGSRPRDAERWHAEVRRRGAVLDALRAWSPPPAHGTSTAELSDPLMVMLWGVTPQRSAAWLTESQAGSGILTGLAASPGVGVGPARVVHSPEQLAEVLEGEVLVAPVTSPGWAPVFSRVSAVVTDVGGVMSHAAIVCREYGLPGVTATVDATRRIVTGQRLRVDGTRGTVTLLDEPTDQGGQH
jgi:phosphohistidine swiveling domain-containing protein